jgi:two-component system, OmpR family, phosphate regulon response regulator PhoB
MFDFDVLEISNAPPAESAREVFGVEMVRLDTGVTEIPRGPALTLSPETTVAAAIDSMRRRRRGSAIVVRNHRPVGVVCDRDILAQACGDIADSSQSFRVFFSTVTSPSRGSSNVGSAMAAAEANRPVHDSEAGMSGTRAGDLHRKVLIVEDEPDLRELLTYNLSAAGFTVQAAENGADGLAAVQRFAPDLVLLDLMLPDIPGTEVCRRIRGGELGGRQPAVMMLTAKGEEIDRVVGFELGADDYVVKPFSVRELVLRVSAIMRSRRPPTADNANASRRRRYEVGPLELDVDGYHLFVDGREVHVSTLEMRLLVYLVEHRGRVRSREDLLEDVWGYKPDVSTRTIDTHVKRLRDKLGDAGSLIETVRGTGYRLSAEFPVVVKE